MLWSGALLYTDLSSVISIGMLGSTSSSATSGFRKKRRKSYDEWISYFEMILVKSSLVKYLRNSYFRNWTDRSGRCLISKTTYFSNRLWDIFNVVPRFSVWDGSQSKLQEVSHSGPKDSEGGEGGMVNVTIMMLQCSCYWGELDLCKARCVF